MTAISQPMAGQSDTSDDLIAELAKLMAQDAQGDKPANPSTAAFPVRIPGGDASPAPASVPRFDFGRAAPAGDAAAVPVAPAAVEPSFKPAPTPQAPEPFNFDFDLGAPQGEATAVPLRAEAAPSPVRADPSFMPVDHDSIAELIAAELQEESDPQANVSVPSAPPVASTPVPTAHPAPEPVSSWAPVAVPANLGNQDKPASPALRPLDLQPATKPEQDRFKVAPVFGLASGRTEASVAPVVNEPSVATPVNPPVRSEPSFGWNQPAASESNSAIDDDQLGRDPIDEIESLIGGAMRVELNRPVEPAMQSERPAPSPALRSLATPTMPVFSPTGRKLSGADEAILAAAEATGVQIGWVDAPDAASAEPAATRRQSMPRAPGMTRALAGPLVAVTLLLAAGFGLYWVLGLGRDAGPAPLLTADASPIKETPAVDAQTTTPQQSIVFNEIDGVVPGAEEQLVSRDQADVNEVTQVPPTNELSEEGLANRKVRTVTVRPDGTIVSGEDSVAGSNILPVARPNVPDVPGAETASPELLASTQPVAETPATETPVAATPEPAAATVAPVTPGSTVPAIDLAGNMLAGKTSVVPLVRPAGLVGPSAATTQTPASPVNAVVDSGVAAGNMLPPPPTNNSLGTLAAPAAQAAAAAPAAAVPQATEVPALGNTAPAYVQLASQRTEDDARTTAQAMVTRFGPLFGGANLEVQRVDLGERGIYYRVRVPATSLQDANTMCTNVKAAGGDCFTM